MLIDFKNSYSDKFTSKSAIKSLLNISPYLKCVAALLCEVLRYENSDRLKHAL